jgi:malonyl-CoA O-methyltransferase
MTSPVSVRDAYAAWAAIYDANDNRTRDADAAVLRAAMLPLDGASVVEIGAGTGKNTAYLATRAAHVVALDMSAAMLARAARRALGSHVTLIEHDVTLPWPVPDASADIVVGNLVLEHVATLAPVFGQARRVLRPGGLLYLAELHPYRQWRGAGARFQTADGEDVRVEAYVHAVSDYVTAGLEAGLILVGLREVDDAAPADGDAAAPPRLLQLTFAAPPNAV